MDRNPEKEVNRKVKSSQETLWTKNFTIITIGTAVSLFGSAIAGFATGLLILDYTGSVFKFAIYMILYEAPRIFMPTLVGPFLDKFSRRRAIFTLDFISAGIYGIFGFILIRGEIGFVPLVIGACTLGAVGSIYQVAYDSFYPMLISEGNMGKAYSISSTMESMMMVVTPISVFLYHQIGIAPLFFVNMVSYLVAAVFETQIDAEESYVLKKEDHFGIKQYRRTYKEGIEYLKSERGLFAIAFFFMFSAFSGGGHMIIGLPYFRDTYGTRGEYLFIFIMAFEMIGRVIAGGFHYIHRIKPNHKFIIAFVVYTYIAFVGGTYLYAPIPLMIIMCFSMGLMSMTSYNIRISTTQKYIPHDKKGRYNGTFQMMNTFGMMAGEFIAGGLADHFDKRLVVVGFSIIEFIAAWLIVFRNREHVSKIYNQET